MANLVPSASGLLRSLQKVNELVFVANFNYVCSSFALFVILFFSMSHFCVALIFRANYNSFAFALLTQIFVKTRAKHIYLVYNLFFALNLQLINVFKVFLLVFIIFVLLLRCRMPPAVTFLC